MNKIALIILAILLPPVAVFIKTKDGTSTLISILLWIFGFVISGIIYALWKVLKD